MFDAKRVQDDPHSAVFQDCVVAVRVCLTCFREYVAELVQARDRQQSTARQEQQRAAAAEARLAEQMAESDMR